MTDRRYFLGSVVAALLATLAPAKAQVAGKVYRIGYLFPAGAQDPGHALPVLQQALADLGYVTDRNLKIEERYAGGSLDRLPGLAAELVSLKVDVIVAVSPSAIRASRDATNTIPIVMAFSGDDPVKAGFVASLARPGGNITGMTSLTSEIAPKWIELVRDALPGVMRAAAQPLDIQLQIVEARGPDQYATAFDGMTRGRAGAVIILSGPEYAQNLVRLAELSALHRLPSLWQFREFVEVGGLLCYGPNIADLTARAAVFIDKILKGANPGELPVQQPTKFALAINLKSARSLRVSIPQSLLLRADEVVR